LPDDEELEEELELELEADELPAGPLSMGVQSQSPYVLPSSRHICLPVMPPAHGQEKV
jgi:hypothetical protein